MRMGVDATPKDLKPDAGYYLALNSKHRSCERKGLTSSILVPNRIRNASCNSEESRDQRYKFIKPTSVLQVPLEQCKKSSEVGCVQCTTPKPAKCSSNARLLLPKKSTDDVMQKISPTWLPNMLCEHEHEPFNLCDLRQGRERLNIGHNDAGLRLTLHATFEKKF